MKPADECELDSYINSDCQGQGCEKWVLANPIVFTLLTSITSLVFIIIYLFSSVGGITLFKST